MADFSASYDAMETMAGKLNTGRDEIGGVLDRLKTQVDELLGEDFKTQQASGKFGDGYQELTNGLGEAINGINDMADALRGMMQAIKDTDAALAGQG